MLLVRLHKDYIDLLNLKAYKLFEISDVTSPGFFFKEANLSRNTFSIEEYLDKLCRLE